MDRTNYTRKIAGWCIVAAVLGAGCAHAPAPRGAGYSTSAGEKASRTALSMVGRPYKYGGDSPAGFDCSGLVRYSYLTAGMDVPRATRGLVNATRQVPNADMRKGDLVFFTERGKKYSHVGMYVGKKAFIHAPSSGKQVRKDSLDDPYWKTRFLGARRFL